MAISATVALILAAAKRFVVVSLTAAVERHRSGFGDLVTGLGTRTRASTIFTVALLAGISLLDLPYKWIHMVETLGIMVVLAQTATWGNVVISFTVTRLVRSRIERDPDAATTVGVLGLIARIGLYSLVLLIALDNIPGLEITTLLAGLGVGGIAVALAVQNLLGDLLASLSIMLDKPFVAGDFVVIDDYSGTVEHVGLKTTRIRSLSGEQLVFSNGDLLNSRIRNYKTMQERRVSFSFGVVYETTSENLEAIPGIVKAVVDQLPQARFERAHFKKFGDFSLNFEVVYWMTTPAYGAYMDTQQAINLGLCQEFQAKGIQFAYPTQTLFVRPEPGRSSPRRP
ncbi:MAG: mechanosensitive ion channel family protein [Firmicutes bacterium]|nr:mechanosensitive ion channel family protein [Bacillota bacterium]